MSSDSQPSVISVTTHGSHAFTRSCWPESSILWAQHLLTGIPAAAMAPGPVPWEGPFYGRPRGLCPGLVNGSGHLVGDSP